jgi:tRNA-splicing ligase RtcB
MEAIKTDDSLLQCANVACMPGIVKYSFAMPDIHLGYGFPIGGVAAFDPEDGGVISPGGVGYDINCGVRLARTNLTLKDVEPKLDELLTALFHAIPCGVGETQHVLEVSAKELPDVLVKGSRWALEHGYATPEDVECTEEGGCLAGADPDAVSDRAFKRGVNQVGTLGSGNHFLEIDIIEQIYHPEAAKVFGLQENGIAMWVHCGSRGFGYQVCDDYIKTMLNAMPRYGLQLPDRQLCCAPVNSPEGKNYFAAMACSANFAWANRQVIMHLARRVFQRILGMDEGALGIKLIYDVCHNVAKMEPYEVGGAKKTLCVHRKGATRAFAPNHPAIPECYRQIGQPVLVPGDMGRCSFLLVGTQKAMEETWGSSCHGAGRVMSRNEAIRRGKGRSIVNELKEKGIIIRARDKRTLAEEMSDAYKDVERVVDVMHSAGITLKVAKFRPIAVMKG